MTKSSICWHFSSVILAWSRFRAASMWGLKLKFSVNFNLIRYRFSVFDNLKWRVLGALNKNEQFKWQCCPHLETSQLICCANQLTGFYVRVTMEFNGLKELPWIKKKKKNNKILHAKFICAISFNNAHREKLCLTQFSTRIYWNRSLAASDLFHMFIQSIKFHTFNCNILKNNDVWIRWYIR